MTLTSIIRTGLPILVELIHLLNSNDLTQMVTFPTRIPDCDSHNPAILDLFISSTMAFSPLGNSDHVVASVSIDLSHHIHHGMPHWNSLQDNLRNVLWEDIFKACACYFLKIHYTSDLIT